MVGKIMLDIRSMHPGDIPAMMYLVNASGWNQTPQDWYMLLNAPGSHWVATRHSQIVGTICALDYDSFIWVAMVLVHPDHRRKGIATMLMEKVLDNYHHRVLRLDATEAGATVYTHFGFNALNKLVRWQIDTPRNINSVHAGFPSIKIEKNNLAILAFDRLVFGGNRSAIFAYLLEKDQDQWYLPSSTKEPAFCFIRPGNSAWQIGPLVADNLEEGERLLLLNLSLYPEQKFYLDSFVDNSTWTEKLIKIGFVKQRSFIRMQQGSNRNFGKIEYQFAIAGPELG